MQVQVRRKESKSHLSPKILSQAKKVIASVIKNRQPLGIEPRELEKELLTKLLNIDENDKNYTEQRNEFWTEFRLVVPSEGVVLDIGTYEDEDGNKMYNNITDYVTYQFIKGHPLVADSRADMLKSHTKEFYVYNPERESQKENIRVGYKKQAYTELAKLSGNTEKLAMVTRLLVGVDPDSISTQQQENMVANFIDKDPRTFVNTVTDKDLEIRSEITRMVEKGILRTQGSSYLYMDTTIGDSMPEAISFFKNKRNSEVVLDLRSKLKDVV